MYMCTPVGLSPLHGGGFSLGVFYQRLMIVTAHACALYQLLHTQLALQL